jgi:hypothetical protein
MYGTSPSTERGSLLRTPALRIAARAAACTSGRRERRSIAQAMVGVFVSVPCKFLHINSAYLSNRITSGGEGYSQPSY